MHRFFLTLLGIISFISVFGQFGGPVEQVEEGIYQVPLYGCNAAFYVGEEGVIVVDAGMTPDEGRYLLEVIRETTDKPINYLILTHYHFDHVGGVKVFPPETKIVCSARYPEVQKKDGGRLLNNFVEEMEASYLTYEESLTKKAEELRLKGNQREADSLSQLVRDYRAYIDSSKAVIPVKADILVDGSYFIKDGKTKKVELRSYDNCHSGTDLVVIFPGATTAHVGDLHFGRSFPFIDREAGGSIISWIKALDDLMEISTLENVLSGHDSQGDLNTLLGMRELLETLLNEVNGCILKGMTQYQTLQNVKMERYSHYPGKDLLEKSIKAVYDELQGK